MLKALDWNTKKNIEICVWTCMVLVGLWTNGEKNLLVHATVASSVEITIYIDA